MRSLPWTESATDFARLADRPLTATEKRMVVYFARQDGCKRVRAKHLALAVGTVRRNKRLAWIYLPDFH